MYKVDRDLKLRLKRNTEQDKSRYVVFFVYKSNNDIFFTDNKYIVAWATKTLKKGPIEPNAFFNKLEDSFKDNVLSKIDSNQTSKEMIAIIKHFAINECYAWKQSVTTLSYLDNEFVMLRDFRGMSFIVYVSNHIIYLPQCELIHRINILRADFVKRETEKCSKELPIIYFYDLQAFMGYINRFGIINDKSSEVECKNIKETYLFLNYDIDLFPDKNYPFLPLTIERRGNNLNISMKKIYTFDHIDPFDYGKNHYSYKSPSTELHTGSHLEPNDEIDVLHLTYDEEVKILINSDSENKEIQAKMINSIGSPIQNDYLGVQLIILVIILNTICFLFYNYARNVVYKRESQRKMLAREQRLSYLSVELKKYL